MATLIAIFGGAVAALGVCGIVSPESLLKFVSAAWRSQRGLYLVSALRLALGAILILGASECRFTTALQVIGGVSVASGLLLPILGFERARRIIEWWVSRPGSFVRIWSLVAVAFGAFLVYAAI